ncbi:hypothetical protein QBC42DRAFT_320633 [Cladorrhinum samala]|uniref:Protein kinase domain-containing protein n=1 Tax=Cladorrhinum samala TaxID=585594 RepID=A0AAV9HU83_9PEZI|nr:hypothetical protein QBC42DRAFT_320633 [Cladorrhinum samala]
MADQDAAFLQLVQQIKSLPDTVVLDKLNNNEYKVDWRLEWQIRLNRANAVQVLGLLADGPGVPQVPIALLNDVSRQLHLWKDHLDSLQAVLPDASSDPSSLPPPESRKDVPPALEKKLNDIFRRSQQWSYDSLLRALVLIMFGKRQLPPPGSKPRGWSEMPLDPDMELWPATRFRDASARPVLEDHLAPRAYHNLQEYQRYLQSIPSIPTLDEARDEHDPPDERWSLPHSSGRLELNTPRDPRKQWRQKSLVEHRVQSPLVAYNVVNILKSVPGPVLIPILECKGLHLPRARQGGPDNHQALGLNTAQITNCNTPRPLELWYDLPPSSFPEQPQTLLSLFLSPKPPQFPLSQRYTLAQNIATAVLGLHSAGYTHKSIHPDRVLISWKASTGLLGTADASDASNAKADADKYPYTLGKGFLVGIESVEDVLEEGGVDGQRCEKEEEEKKEENYHQSAERRKLQAERGKGKYKRSMDLYALGVLLIEICFWESVNDGKSKLRNMMKLHKESQRTAAATTTTTGEEKNVFLALAEGQVSEMMGKDYSRAVIACLMGFEEDEQEEKEEKEETVNLKLAVRYLDLLNKLKAPPIDPEQE